MLKKITLSNWRSHALSTIELSGGTNLFLGPMGSGKSSVVDALCFALYGTYPKLGRRDVKLEEVANFRHTGQSVWVEVEWTEEEGGKSIFYKVRRELDPPQAWIYADAKLLQKGPKAVSQEVERLLQIPYELFARAVYAEQNRLDYWLSLPAGNRKAELDRLLGLDSFERSRTNLTTKLNLVKEQAALLEAAAPAARLDEAKAQYKRRGEERARLEAELVQARLAQARVAEQLAGAQTQYAQGEKTQRHLTELTERRQKTQGAIAALEKTLGPLPDGVELERAQGLFKLSKSVRADAQRGAQEARENQQRAVVASGNVEQKARTEAERSARVEKLLQMQRQMLEGRRPEELRAELTGAQVRLQEQLSQAARVEGQLADAHKVLQALAVHAHLAGPQEHEEGAACPVCRQPLDEQRAAQIRSDEEAQIAKLKEEQGALVKGIGALKNEHEKLMRGEAEVSRLEAQLQALAAPPDAAELLPMREKAAGAVEVARTAVQAAIERLEKAEREERAAGERVRALEQSQAWQAQLMEARRSLAEVEAELGSISFSPLLWNDLVLRREKLMREQAGLEEQVRSLAKLLESAAQLCEAARLVAEDLEAKRESAAQKRRELDELGTFRNVLMGTQGQLRTLLVSEINLALMKIWPLMYPYGDWTAVRLEAGERDYAIQIQQGQWKSLEAHASGGERACLGLSLRAALSILLTPQLGWLILDEPTHNLDGPAVQQLGRAMSEKLPQIIGQVIVITHEGQLLESTPGRVIRFSRDKAKGEDTRIEVE